MRKALVLPALAACLAIFAAGPAHARMLLESTVDEMCCDAAAIVEGTYLGKDAVNVERIYKGADGIPLGKMQVDRLDEHSRVPGLWTKDAAPIRADKVVLFLTFDPDKRAWRSLATVAEDGRTGSCGLFWYDDETCYGYHQEMNPGPYILSSGKDRNSSRRIPKDVADLRSQIDAGLANAAEWNRTLAMKDPAEKARALARYLLPRTSPRGDRDTYRYRVRKELPPLGGPAADALVEVLRSAQPGDKLDPAVLNLYDCASLKNGPEVKAAAPLLCKLLDRPEQVPTYYVLCALRAIADPGMVAFIRPMLKKKDSQVQVEASFALAACKDMESFPAIASLIPDPIGAKDAQKVVDLLNALYAMDPAAAGPIIDRLIDDPALKDLKGLIHGARGK